METFLAGLNWWHVPFFIGGGVVSGLAAGIFGIGGGTILAFAGLSAMAASGVCVEFAQAISTRTLKLGFETHCACLAGLFAGGLRSFDDH